ncbi:unnamed protein product [Closterium sp. Naga37s-1]|nr:unnamed protein product [Closterium sp. Naga37s-1]
MLPSFMVKLFWKRMDKVAEGVGEGGGAEHEGGGEGAPRVVVEYSYEEEEEIEEDTSRQAQHGQAKGDDGAVEEQEGGAAAHEGGAGVQQQEGGAAVQDFGTGVQQQEGEAAAQEGGVGGQQQEGVAAAQEGGAGGQEQEGGEAAQECRRGDERQVAITRRHCMASGSRQAGPSTGRPSTAGHSTSAIASGGQVVKLLQRVPESSKSTLKQCSDAVNGVTEERKLLEGARTKLDKMSGKIIEGVASAITKASEDAVEKQLKLVEERLVASVVKGIEKAVKEDLFYSTLPPESMKELKDVVREGYQEAEAGRLEVLTEAMARGFRGSAGPSTRSRQEEGVAGVCSGVERRVHERLVPPFSSVGGHVGSPVASPPSRARQTVGKSFEDNEVIVLDQSPLQKTSEAAPKPPPDAFPLLRAMLQDLGKRGGKGVVAGEKSGAPIESVASVGKGAVEK